MSFEITGILHRKYDTESKSESFKTREFVIKTEEQYPQFVKFQLTQDRCSAIDSYNVEDKIKVHFDLRGREWQDKFFTNLNAWRIEKAESNGMDHLGAVPPPVMQPPSDNQDPFGQDTSSNSNADNQSFDDDLPF